MRVSLINPNLLGADAIGSCIVNQVRYFRRRGDDVRVYLLYEPERVPDDVVAVTHVTTLAELTEGTQEHFRSSDLYIYHYPLHYLLVESIRTLERGIIVFYYHNVTPPELWGRYAGRDLLARGVKRSALVHYADFCITDSPFNKQSLIESHEYPAERIFVLPLAVALDQFTPGVRDPELLQKHGLQGSQVLLFVGRMAYNKRVDLLVEAVAKTKTRVPNAKLLLVGDSSSDPVLREVVAAARVRAEELGVSRDVVWTGQVEDLRSYYRLADVYVTASLHEGFAVPLIEAMACGLPVVASRAGAMPWVLEDAGLLYSPGQVDDLADAIVRVLEDRDLHRTLVERGLRRARTFGIEQYEQNLARILEHGASYGAPNASGKPQGATDRACSWPSSDLDREHRILGSLASEIAEQSDVALRDYQVRSRVPVVGSLIAWVRRNLTSHLREPYVDPIVERQVAVNGRVAEWIDRMTRSRDRLTRQQAELESRVMALETQIQSLLRQRRREGPTEDR